MQPKINKILNKIGYSKPKIKISSSGSCAVFNLTNSKIHSLQNLREVSKTFENQINTIYKKNPDKLIEVSSWIFAMHPRLADHYKISYYKNSISFFNNYLKNRNIKKIYYLENGKLNPIFTVMMLDGKIKTISGSAAHKLFLSLPTFFLDLKNPEVKKRLKELKIIN